jgi:hypothetical protein
MGYLEGVCDGCHYHHTLIYLITYLTDSFPFLYALTRPSTLTRILSLTRPLRLRVHTLSHTLLSNHSP